MISVDGNATAQQPSSSKLPEINEKFAEFRRRVKKFGLLSSRKSTQYMSGMNLGSSGSSSFGSDLGSASSKNTDSIIQQTQMALQMQQVQNLLQGAGEKCIYPKCIPKPGKYLDRSESSCLTNCLDRYLDTFQLVAKTYANRIKQESGASTGGLSSFQ